MENFGSVIREKKLAKYFEQLIIKYEQINERHYDKSYSVQESAHS